MASNAVILKDVAVVGLSHWDAAPFLKKVTDIVPSIIYIFNQTTQSNEYSNRSLGESLGFSAQDVQEMGAGLMPTLCHPDDLARVGAHFAALSDARDGEVLQVEYRVRHKDGNWVWLLSHDTVFDRDTSGQVVRHIGVASDITAQKTAEERARAEHLKARTVNDELRTFSYAMSHDMKAPSNTLNLLLTELLETHRDTLDPDAIELTELALGTVAHMGNLVDDVLNYTRVINQDFVLTSVPLNALLNQVTEELDGIIRHQGGVVDIADLPLVAADATQLRIYFHALIENAMKFHKPETIPRVSITCSMTKDLKSYDITVRDNGIGIDTSKHEQVFKVFKRLNTAPGHSGTGLGLAICRRIAANHGSTITLVSSPAQGAAFTIRLPKA